MESPHDSSEFGDKITYYKPYVPNIRRSGTGCITEINDHLFEGRYTPTWPDGKRRSKNVYARTRAECEQKLTALINEMNAQRELAKTGARSSESFFPDPNLSNKQRIIRYLQENPGEINKSKIARTLNLDRSTVCRNLKKIAAEQKSADNDDLPSKSDNSDAVSAF